MSTSSAKHDLAFRALTLFLLLLLELLLIDLLLRFFGSRTRIFAFVTCSSLASLLSAGGLLGLARSRSFLSSLIGRGFGCRQLQFSGSLGRLYGLIATAKENR